MAGYGDVLKRLRAEAHLTQAELAKRARVNREMVSRAEASGNVGVLNLQRMVVALNSSITDLFGGGRGVRGPQIPWSKLSPEQTAYLEKLIREMVQEGG